MPLTTVSPGVMDTQATATWRNRIINGDMRIDQRNNGASVGSASGSSAFLVDRWLFAYTQTNRMTAQQNAGAVTPPVGFTNYLGITSSSAYSVLSSDTFGLFHRIEGFNVSDLGWGTANAQTITLSFWVRSSLTGTFGGALQNSAADRSYPFSYTISTSNTWEQKTITVAGDTTGTWVTNNGLGVQIVFGLGSGATWSGTAGAWASANLRTTTSAVSVVGTNGATFYITGVQFEAGTAATAFERRDYGRELAMCQRYYESLYFANNTMAGTGGFIAPGICENTARVQPYYPFKVQKRAGPSTTLSAIGTFGLRSTGSSVACTSGAFGAPSNTYAQGEFNNGGGGLIAGGAGWLTNHDGNAKIEWSAEL